MSKKLGLTLIISLSLTGLVWASAYSTAVIADSPLSYFQFEDGLSTTGAPCVDSMGLVTAQYKRRGTGPDIALGTSIPTLGYAAVFRGASDGDGTAVSINDNGYTGDKLTNASMTIELLMRTSADSAGYPTLVSYHDTITGPELKFGNFAGPPIETFQPFVSACDSTWYAWPPGILGDGSWHHYAVTFDYNSVSDETTAAIYMDKNLKGTHVFAGQITPNTADIWKTILLGAGGNDYFYFNGYEGLMDEVAIYDYALTPAQITAHYNELPEPTTIALLGLGGLLLRRRKR
jgi:hypothetical protein